MDSWSRDLPPVAQERIRRQQGSRVAGSLLSAPAAAALVAADLEPVGEAMGCIVIYLGLTVGGGCGSYNIRQNVTPVLTSGRAGGATSWGYGPYVRALYHAYDTALRRMLAEAGALGADGVVGVDLRWSRLNSGARELLALGTAVRRRGGSGVRGQGARPFCTELGGEDVAKAALSGWQPLGIAIGLSIALKHEDSTLLWQTSMFTGPGNVEVAGFTNLLHAARLEARQKLTSRAEQFGGPAGPGSARHVVISRADLEVRERVCGEQRDFVAEATFVGTVLAHDGGGPARAPVSSLSILPLRGGTTRNPRGNGAAR